MENARKNIFKNKDYNRTNLEKGDEYNNNLSLNNKEDFKKKEWNDLDIEDFKFKSIKKKKKKNKTKKENYFDNREYKKEINSEDKFDCYEKETGRYIVHNSIVNKIISKEGIIFKNCLMKYNKKFGYFDKIDNHTMSTIIYSNIPRNKLNILKDSDIRSILKLIQIHPSIQIDDLNENKQKKLINCENCVLKVNKGENIEIREHSKEYLFLNVIKANYRECYDFENSKFKRFIESLTNNDEELIKLIRQVMGYCFSNLNNGKKAFFFYGRSNTGKSVLLNLLINICGENNVSNIELQNLNKRENIATLYGKKLNVCNELPDYKMTDTGIFKALVSDNDKVTGKALYNNPFSFYNKAKLVFACNNMPSLNSNKSLDYDAFFNRLIIIPCLNSIPSHKQDKNLFKKLLKEKDLIFTWAMGGLQDYIDNGNQFIEPKITKKFMREYVASVSMVDSFIKELCQYKEGEYSFKYEVEELFIAYYGYQKETMPKESEIKELIEKLRKDYLFKRINRDGENRYGFLNLKLLV
ncbi:MAG: hypothetical protein KIB11_06205 [Clostridium perfringens]|nr:hypothetical protein [Clostridium perfringens]